jgi:AcrR family transcriptional regulator
MLKRDYFTKDSRREQILGAAYKMAKSEGLQNLTRDGVARAAGAANGSVTYCFGNMGALTDAIITHAIDSKDLRLIAEGIINNNEIALNAPKMLRTQALNSLK